MKRLPHGGKIVPAVVVEPRREYLSGAMVQMFADLIRRCDLDVANGDKPSSGCN